MDTSDTPLLSSQPKRMITIPESITKSREGSPINPFETLVPEGKGESVLRVVKWLLIPLQILRLLLIIVVLFVFMILLRVVLIGHDQREATKGVRKAIFVFLASSGARVYIFLMGYMWVKKTNMHLRDPKCPLICSNHVSGTDAVIYMWIARAPAFVAKEETKKMPFFGPLSAALRTVYVSRAPKPAYSSSNPPVFPAPGEKVPSLVNMTKTAAGISVDSEEMVLPPSQPVTPMGSRGGSTAKIIARLHAHKPGDPPLVVFPEATTANQRAILPFRTGAFRAGVPVQPCVLRLPFKHADPSDATRGTMMVGAILCRELFNRLEVEWLPAYYPSQEEKDDPVLYSQNVRDVITTALGTPQCGFTYADKLVYTGKREYAESTSAWRDTFGPEVRAPGYKAPEEEGELTQLL
eukprot:gnl/Dysnectes_brevis/3088_a3838_706.p2 GENE.gnl/Dysnectes_brevis/3088_a3838_706~~gnl/Dysnectes_brevis/3088_a3838_706.p2  ORF type:complete len:409 (+),score=125.42 gnl/Dysnectes_brevis/3088_a3838_706:129-1355(+)